VLKTPHSPSAATPLAHCLTRDPPRPFVAEAAAPPVLPWWAALRPSFVCLFRTHTPLWLPPSGSRTVDPLLLSPPERSAALPSRPSYSYFAFCLHRFETNEFFFCHFATLGRPWDQAFPTAPPHTPPLGFVGCALPSLPSHPHELWLTGKPQLQIRRSVSPLFSLAIVPKLLSTVTRRAGLKVVEVEQVRMGVVAAAIISRC
jgi:hypothetical protein